MFNRPLKTLACALIFTQLLQLSACGTLLYPNRQGQGQGSGKIDPAVAILNGVGLVLFVIPGIIAFVVDFSTGAIYYPKGLPGKEKTIFDKLGAHDSRRLDAPQIEAAVYQARGIEIDLHGRTVEAYALPGQTVDSLAWGSPGGDLTEISLAAGGYASH